MPRWSVELAIGVLVPVAFVAARLPLEPFMADRSPFAFNFVAVLIASVIAGWRAGLLALVVGQLGNWFAVVQPQWSFVLIDQPRTLALIVTTTAQALLLVVIAFYQREVDKGVAERERRLELQEHARREIDHRIRNNFQTVLALIHLQTQRSKDAEAKEALRQVSERIRAIATVTERLALRGENLTTVSIRDHLRDLCAQLDQGLAGDNIDVHCEVADAEAGAVEATYIGLIVNELVTNALKHAFADGRTGWVRVEADVTPRGLELVVRDNGLGMKPRSSTSGTGLGQKLVQRFVRELGGSHDVVTSGSGTAHHISVPALGTSQSPRAAAR